MSKNAPEIIDLLDSSDDEDAGTTATIAAAMIPTRVLADGCVEILSSDDDEGGQENCKPAAIRKFAATVPSQSRGTPIAKRRRTSLSNNQDDCDDETKKPSPVAGSAKSSTLLANSTNQQQDVQVVAQSTNSTDMFRNPLCVPAAAARTNNNNHDDDDDEELQLLGATGQNALSEFPHARENCVNFLFGSSRHEQHCAHCVSSFPRRRVKRN